MGGQLYRRVLQRVERLSLRGLATVFCLGLVVSAALFLILSRAGSGIQTSPPGGEIGPLDALYFSVVTISSLGYGDLQPVGWGRLLAALEVLFGLIILALAVARMASQQESEWIRLLYSSDQERRLSEFVDEMKKTALNLSSQSGWRLPPSLEPALADSARLANAVRRYLSFHVDRGKLLGEVGTRASGLKLVAGVHRLGDSLDRLFAVVYGRERVLKAGELRTTLCTILETIVKYASHEDVRIAAQRELSRIRTLRDAEGAAGRRRSVPYSEDLVKEVGRIVKDEIWARNLDRRLAAELDISRKVADKAVKTLRERAITKPVS